VLGQIQKPEPCPTLGIATKVQFITDQAEADAVIRGVKEYYQKMMLRNAYYYPIFVFVLILLIAIFLLAVSQTGWLISEGCEKAIVRRRQKQLFDKQPLRSHDDQGTGATTAINIIVAGRPVTVNIDRADVLWDFRDLRSWEERLTEIRKLNIDMNIRDLEKFAFFFAKTINRICACLVNHERIP
jgi:hypothetical protein